MATEKKAAKKKPAKKTTAGNGPAGKRVTIKMYNVGFGDAFLVLIPDGNQHRRILVDCGSIEAAKNLAMQDIVDRIIQDVTDADGRPRIDVVIATHRHKDHVSGFEKSAWDDVEVKEVWMPWTEHPTDKEARKIRNTQSNLALALNRALAAQAAAPGAAANAALNRSLGIVANALMLTNDKAMKMLHSGFTGNPSRHFLPEPVSSENKRTRTFTTDALPGVKVHVMGPSRDRDVIRDMDPPAGKSFLRMHGALDGQPVASAPPFGPEFRRAQREFGAPLSPFDLDEIHKAGSSSDLAVAVALDKAVNGTSLMLMLEVSGTFLLFPGDAQWGTWTAALADPEWSDLLKRVTFYKIGHHGSHNATPVDFVEKIPPDVSAMASTLTRKIWPDIPRSPLLERLLEKKAHIARSDKPTEIAKPFSINNGVIETHIRL